MVPVVAVVAPLGLAPILGVTAVVAFCLQGIRTGIWFSPPNHATIVLGLLFFWMLASYSWTIDAGGFQDKILRYLGIMVAGVVIFERSLGLDSNSNIQARRLILIGLGVSLALVFVDRITDSLLRRLVLGINLDEYMSFIFYNRAITVLALLIWPASLIIWRQRPIWAVTGWVASLAIFFLLNSNAAIFGLLIGAAAFMLSYWRPKRVTAVLGLALAALILISPLLPSRLPDRATLKQHQELITNSGYHRILIWEFVGEKIAERPVLGWGFHSSRNIPGSNVSHHSWPTLPLHPHSSSLQLWLELGLPGAMLGAILIVVIMFRIGRMTTKRIDKAVSVGLTLTVLTISNLSYGAWQSWWLAAIWLAASFMCVAIERTEGDINRIR